MNEKIEKILIVDDEMRIREMVKSILENREYKTYLANNGQEAILSVKENEPDLVILDIMMPEMDGYECLKRIREEYKCLVIMLTAKGEDYDQVKGFEYGADDYIIKPFTPMVLVARIEALLRRAKRNSIVNKETGNIKINKSAREVYLNDKLICLNKKEFDLLVYLSDNYNISLSRDQILEEVWGYDYLGTDSTVDTHINRLRKKLKKCSSYIKTVRGYGYRFEV